MTTHHCPSMECQMSGHRLPMVPAGPPLHEQADRDGDNVPSEECSCAMTESSMRSCAVHGEKSTEEILAAWEAKQRADNVPSDRVREYADVLIRAMTADNHLEPWEDYARAVVAVADREQVALRAEIERLTHLLGSHADGHRCTCTMIDPGNFHVEGGNAHPPEWEQDPWCPTHPDVNQIKGELRNLALTWDADADANEDTHPKEARAVMSCARELLATLRGPKPTEVRPLPLHRTEAGYPNCSTCDGGGCLDCTDPA